PWRKTSEPWKRPYSPIRIAAPYSFPSTPTPRPVYTLSRRRKPTWRLTAWSKRPLPKRWWRITGNMLRIRRMTKREEGRGKREERRGKREEGRGGMCWLNKPRGPSRHVVGMRGWFGETRIARAAGIWFGKTRSSRPVSCDTGAYSVLGE